MIKKYAGDMNDALDGYRNLLKEFEPHRKYLRSLLPFDLDCLGKTEIRAVSGMKEYLIRPDAFFYQGLLESEYDSKSLIYFKGINFSIKEETVEILVKKIKCESDLKHILGCLFDELIRSPKIGLTDSDKIHFHSSKIHYSQSYRENDKKDCYLIAIEILNDAGLRFKWVEEGLDFQFPNDLQPGEILIMKSKTYFPDGEDYFTNINLMVGLQSNFEVRPLQ